MTRIESCNEYRALLKEEGFCEERIPVASLKRVFLQYVGFIVIFFFVGVISIDYYYGFWEFPEDAVVVSKNRNPMGFHDPNTVRLQTISGTSKINKNHYVKADAEQVYNCPEYTRIRSYCGIFTGVRYETKLYDNK